MLMAASFASKDALSVFDETEISIPATKLHVKKVWHILLGTVPVLLVIETEYTDLVICSYLLVD